jgi:DNA-binding MurR/RpiR family transcriptional regulator
MQRTIDYLIGPGQQALQKASSLILSARDVFVTGIGASWNAALCAGTLFYLGGRPAYIQEAGELLHFTAIPRGSVIVTISRTGRSIEIVQLLAKAEASGATLIGIPNSADSPVAKE